MDERELRSLVREAVERHLGRPQSPPRATQDLRLDDETPDSRRTRFQSRGDDPHPSHILLRVVPGSEAEDGMCIIEPDVRCNHCGFCQSFGH